MNMKNVTFHEVVLAGMSLSLLIATVVLEAIVGKAPDYLTGAFLTAFGALVGERVGRMDEIVRKNGGS